MVALRSKHLSTLSFGHAAHEVVSAALLLLSNSVGVVALGALLFPLLWHHGGPGLAAGYLATRVAEALLLAAGTICQLLLIPLSALGDSESASSRAAAASPSAGGSGGITRADLASLAIRANFYSFQIAMLVLGLGSLPVCLLLLRRQLLPAWMAAWGVLGYSLLAAGSVAELYGVEGTGVPLAIPGGMWEMALGLGLLVRGGFLTGRAEAGASGAKKQA
ncbi:hypothetical protein HXX76_001013 [Chlamydomonas incerta]|uniref:Uncharacterized protein n=1 Tax=Chlamydomonas incerta TaxID=51695 RepID=A0A835WBE2_CHLIN|nr:hypothetical protein HXX76_001013 [Chlamydomonas incerta]|eukprot:KAG2444256.1 hypothetical protein HXX76_001013 [Chlamydomonas incerta]